MTKPRDAVHVVDGPLVTVGLPVHREAIEQLRDSIRSVLNQTFRNWELVIIADGAPSTTLDYLESLSDPRIRVVSHEVSAGLPRRLNEIARLAKGEFLARFDADDIMLPHRLDHQLRIIRETNADLVSGRAIIIDETGQVIGESPVLPGNVTPEAMVKATPFIHPTVFARTSWFIENSYDEGLLRSQDKALWLSGATRSRYWRDDRPVIFYRISMRLDSGKYARTASFERKVVRRHGPERIGHVGTAIVLARSIVKQLIVSGAAAMGLAEIVINRRFDRLDGAHLARWAAVMRISTAWDTEPDREKEGE